MFRMFIPNGLTMFRKDLKACIYRNSSDDLAKIVHSEIPMGFAYVKRFFKIMNSLTCSHAEMRIFISLTLKVCIDILDQLCNHKCAKVHKTIFAFVLNFTVC